MLSSHLIVIVIAHSSYFLSTYPDPVDIFPTHWHVPVPRSIVVAHSIPVHASDVHVLLVPDVGGRVDLGRGGDQTMATSQSHVTYRISHIAYHPALSTQHPSRVKHHTWSTCTSTRTLRSAAGPSWLSYQGILMDPIFFHRIPSHPIPCHSLDWPYLAFILASISACHFCLSCCCCCCIVSRYDWNSCCNATWAACSCSSDNSAAFLSYTTTVTSYH